VGGGRAAALGRYSLMHTHNERAQCRMQDAVAVGDAVALVNEMRHSTADKTSPFGACGSQLQVFGMGGGEEGFGLWSRSYTEASIARVCQSKAGRHHPEEWAHWWSRQLRRTTTALTSVHRERCR